MRESGNLVYGRGQNFGVLFSNLTSVLIAGFREPRADHGDGVLEAIRWMSGSTLPGHRHRITRDSRSVREVRSWGNKLLSEDISFLDKFRIAIAKDLGIDSSYFYNPEDEKIAKSIAVGDTKLGAWLTVSSALSSVRHLNVDLSDRLKRYTDFIEAHLDLERSLLKRASIGSQQNEIIAEAEQWLVLPRELKEDDAKTYPGTARLLLWIALADVGLRISSLKEDATLEYEYLESKSTAANYLPSIENGSYVGSVAKWIKYLQVEYFKDVRKPKDGNRTSRKTMCRTIERLIEEQLNQDLPNGAEYREVDPRYRANAIDERLGRYISGKEHFGVYQIGELLGQEQITLATLCIALTAQLDDYTRMLLEFSGITPENIVEAYTRYPEIYSVVLKRFRTFEEEGTLRP